MKQLAVLISNAGTGSNLQGIIDAIEDGLLKGQIAVVVSDTKDAYGLVRAKKHNIPTHIYHAKEETLEELLTRRFPVDYVVLTGWKKIIPSQFIKTFENKILNIHPGLIPDTMTTTVENPDKTSGLWNKGKFTEKAVQDFFDSNATYAGSSVHFLTEEFDFGPVLERCFEKIHENDTVETLYQRLKKKENKILVKALIKLCK